MKFRNGQKLFCITAFFLSFLITAVTMAQIAEIEVTNTGGFERNGEYVIVSLQVRSGAIGAHCILVDTLKQDTVYAQIFNRRMNKSDHLENFYLIAPIDLRPEESRRFQVISGGEGHNVPETDLQLSGKELDLTIENRFFCADFRRDENEEGQKYHSGQLNRLAVKNHDNFVLRRKSNRMHWAPNFRRTGEENYSTIAHWDPPDSVVIDTGPYLIRIFREGKAPECPEIKLTAAYYFLAGAPYFRFYSEMEVQQDISLSLLRNDEMTMDSLFTHVAFIRPDGHIEDYPFALREEFLQSNPIGNTDPWLCFYHAQQGYAFGSIRILYDISNDQGLPAPTFLPHTKISNGAGGGKYWNRRLIHENDTFVPAGSRYREENAYLLFDIGDPEKYGKIIYWADRLHEPIRVKVRYTAHEPVK